MMTAGAATGGHTLIASDRVEGTAVRGRDDEPVGTIARLMIDKTSGRVAYAVLEFGGMLGLGEGYRALPWETLRFDPDSECYRVDSSEADLRGAPSLDGEGRDLPADRDWETTLHAYYRVRPYWGI